MGYMMSEEEKAYLTNYDDSKYMKPSVATDIAVFTVSSDEVNDTKRLPKRKLKVLLIQRGQYPFKDCYGLPGGFLRKDETLEECAMRELKEETNVLCDSLELIGTASEPERDPRGWILSVQYMALIDSSKLDVRGGDDASAAMWFDVFIDQNNDSNEYTITLKRGDIRLNAIVEEQVLRSSVTRRFRIVDQDERIAFDHSTLIVKALVCLREWIDTTDIGFNLVPDRFSLTQLQQIHEAVKGEKLLTPGFRRKIQKFIEETDDYENGGHDAHRPAKLFEEGSGIMNSKHTPFCIICGEDFGERVLPSKEHIIPEALGNKKLVTYSVCRDCNNALGGNVDNYLTDHILVKLIRRIELDKGDDVHIFNKKMTDDRGDTYVVTDNGPKAVTKVEEAVDGDPNHIRIRASDEEIGREIAKGILSKRYNLPDEEIEKILADPQQYKVGKKQELEAGTFTVDASIDMIRFRLAAIKIAYEFAIEKIGEIYAADESAAILRAYLKAGRDGKKTFNDDEAKDIIMRCHVGDAFTEITDHLAELYKQLTGGHPIKYLVYISKDAGNQLICGIRILDNRFLTFTVFLSRDANMYLRGKTGYMAAILEDGSLFEA